VRGDARGDLLEHRRDLRIAVEDHERRRSHTDRLYETLTRHRQTWRRCNRGELAVRITAAEDALDEEARLIRKLKPRDNLLGQPVEEEVPF
jgi:hypothetical protein